MFGKATVKGLLALAMFLAASFAQGGNHAEWPTDWNNWSDPALLVTVGNPGNTVDPSTGSLFGAVGYVYQMGKYEVTAAQYTDFLNHKAATDTYGLYSAGMWDTYGCKIQRSGTSGNYTYSVASDYANRPVNYVSWYDSIRFINWLQNGQGSGSTESGTYTITGTGPNWTVAIPDAATRAAWAEGANQHWVLPSDNEWYKAAYHKNDGATGDYWDYPTGFDTPAIGRDMTEATNAGNNANYNGTPYPIDSPYYTTVAGEFQLSDSPYGTFDQGGNVFEWNEADPSLYGRFSGVRGGSFYYPPNYTLASYSFSNEPTYEDLSTGFRVARVPEPGSILLIVSGAIAALILWRRRPQGLFIS